MKLLLDTQIALWWLVASPRLKSGTQRLIARSACVVSVASIWEVAIKHYVGKLPVEAGVFREGMVEAGAAILPITDTHAIASAGLPRGHSDPFDRLLVATAVNEELRLLTCDRVLLIHFRPLLGHYLAEA